MVCCSRFFAFNFNLPLTLRSAFYPLFGDRVWGWTGHIIDTLAVFATLFGLATSLGFGTEQALAGLNFLFGTPTGNIARVTLIGLITLTALVSVLRGLDGGVKILSEINIGLALLLMLFIIAVGPTAAIFDVVVSGGVKTFGEPVVDGSQQIVGVLTPVLTFPQAREAHRSPEFKGLGLLVKFLPRTFWSAKLDDQPRRARISPMSKLPLMSSRTMVNGKPVETAMACRAVNAPAPPTNSNTAATAPSNTHQKTR